MRILEVNHQSLLGMTHTEAVQILRSVGDALLVLVCDGFDPKAAAAIEVRARVSGALMVTSTSRSSPLSSQEIAGSLQPLFLGDWLEFYLRSQIPNSGFSLYELEVVASS